MIYLYQKMKERLDIIKQIKEKRKKDFRSNSNFDEQSDENIDTITDLYQEQKFLENSLKEYDELRERAKNLGKELSKVNSLIKDDCKGNLR